MTDRILSEPLRREILEIVRAELESLTPNVEPMVDAKVAAEHLSVKPATLRFWASTNFEGIPVHRFGKAVRFKLSELESWSKRKVA